jgi:lysophospholipase L1-like esterase
MMLKNFHRLALWLFAVAFCATPQLRAGAQEVATDAYAIPATDEGLPGDGPIRRYDWFRNLWQTKRTAWSQSIDRDRGAVVFLGDSITQGWGDDFANSFPGMKVANRGISGDTTRGMLIRLEEDVLSLEPSCVVLLMGTNDLEEQASPETIAGNLKLIVDALKKHDAQMPIILCEVFPSSASKSRPAEKIQRVNALYRELVKGDPQITVLETYILFADAMGDAKPQEFPDLLHPNAAGYEKWAGALRPIFATLGLLETDADQFEVEPGFESLFNGKDLTGWCFHNKANEVSESFDGVAASSDGRYRAINDRLVVVTPPQGRKVQQIWTTKQFPEDFTLRLEFRATPNADSGVFVRGKQLQCRDYPLAGPYTDLSQYRQGDWNSLEIVVVGDTARCTCNGELLEANFELPVTGPIGLEGDRGQLEYRRLRVGPVQ